MKINDNNYNNIRVMIAGGDGSVSWVIDEMNKYEIDFQVKRIIFNI